MLFLRATSFHFISVSATAFFFCCREEDERLASKRAAAAMSSAAEEGKAAEGEKDGVAATTDESDKKKPRTLLEAAKELRKATENMDANTVKQMRAKEEEHRMLREANQVRCCQPLCFFHRVSNHLHPFRNS